jgi:hypothetical protein
VASDVFLFVVFFVSYLDFTFALFGDFISYSVGTIFVVDNLWLDVDLINDGLLFGVLGIDDLFLLFFW